MSTSTSLSAGQRADKKWLDRSEHWGEWERFDERPEDLDPREVALTGRTSTGSGVREAIFMMKSTSGPQVRFYAIGKGHVGKEHAHVLAATCWAYGSGYLRVVDTDDEICLQLAAREEVLSGGAPDDRHAEAVSV